MTSEQTKNQVLHYWQYLGQLARKRFPDDENFALEALDYALDKLQADDWVLLRGRTGKGFSAFLTTTVWNLFTDYQRKAGKTRQTPRWISERGGFWKQAWHLLCLQRLSKHEAREILRVYAAQIGKQDYYVDEVITTILQREKSLPDQRTISLDVHDEDEAAEVVLGREDNWMLTENNILLQTIFIVLGYFLPAQQSAADCEGTVKVWIDKLRGTLNLDDEEYLLLKMVHEDGLKVVEAGRRLGLNSNQVSARYRRLLERINQAFQKCGLEHEMKALIGLES